MAGSEGWAHNLFPKRVPSPIRFGLFLTTSVLLLSLQARAMDLADFSAESQVGLTLGGILALLGSGFAWVWKERKAGRASRMKAMKAQLCCLHDSGELPEKVKKAIEDCEKSGSDRIAMLAEVLMAFLGEFHARGVTRDDLESVFTRMDAGFNNLNMRIDALARGRVQ